MNQLFIHHPAQNYGMDLANLVQRNKTLDPKSPLNKDCHDHPTML